MLDAELINYMVQGLPWAVHNYLAAQKYADYTPPEGPVLCS